MINCVYKNSVLFQKPLKEVPKVLIRKLGVSKSEYCNFNKSDIELNTYAMYDRISKKIVGHMKSGVVYFCNEKYSMYNLPIGFKSYYIGELKINKESRGKGFGKLFLKFAKAKSKVCDKRLHLIAANIDDKPPHLFYYANGLVPDSSCLDRLFRNMVANKQPFKNNEMTQTIMFVPRKYYRPSSKAELFINSICDSIEEFAKVLKEKFTLERIFNNI